MGRFIACYSPNYTPDIRGEVHIANHSPGFPKMPKGATVGKKMAIFYNTLKARGSNVKLIFDVHGMGK
jgi:hypothetical protein